MSNKQLISALMFAAIFCFPFQLGASKIGSSVYEYASQRTLKIIARYTNKDGEQLDVGQSTGFLIGNSGHILTVKHIVQDNWIDLINSADWNDFTFTAQFNDFPDKKLMLSPVEVAPYDRDALLLKIIAPTDSYRVFPLANQDTLNTEVKYVATSFERGDVKMEKSDEVSLSFPCRSLSSSSECQINTKLDPGNSGSPLFNPISGEVIGMIIEVPTTGSNVSYFMHIGDLLGWLGGFKIYPGFADQKLEIRVNTNLIGQKATDYCKAYVLREIYDIDISLTSDNGQKIQLNDNIFEFEVESGDFISTKTLPIHTSSSPFSVEAIHPIFDLTHAQKSVSLNQGGNNQLEIDFSDRNAMSDFHCFNRDNWITSLQIITRQDEPSSDDGNNFVEKYRFVTVLANEGEQKLYAYKPSYWTFPDSTIQHSLQIFAKKISVAEHKELSKNLVNYDESVDATQLHTELERIIDGYEDETSGRFLGRDRYVFDHISNDTIVEPTTNIDKDPVQLLASTRPSYRVRIPEGIGADEDYMLAFIFSVEVIKSEKGSNHLGVTTVHPTRLSFLSFHSSTKGYGFRCHTLKDRTEDDSKIPKTDYGSPMRFDNCEHMIVRHSMLGPNIKRIINWDSDVN